MERRTDAHHGATSSKATLDNPNRNMAAATDTDVSLAADTKQPSNSSPAAPAVAAKQQRKPPPETTESLWLRRWSIVSFWAVVLFLGLPVWLKTTAIYRAELPLQDMTDWAEAKV